MATLKIFLDYIFDFRNSESALKNKDDYSCVHTLLVALPKIDFALSVLINVRCQFKKNKTLNTTNRSLNMFHSMYEGGSESSVIGVITLLIDIIGCCIMP